VLKIKAVLTALLVSGFGLPALAQTATPGVDQRQIIQEKRIEQGTQSGALTPKEATKLEKGQEHVQKLEDRAKADGKVMPLERRRLHHAQDVQSKRIHREKHDHQHDCDHDGKRDHKMKGKHRACKTHDKHHAHDELHKSHEHQAPMWQPGIKAPAR